ncbi:hypothetical protein CDAR_591171 [Caerostris darwini]|uniref:Uncharacterized protein n=1 Tax=Caerostris darwini TaxID=1538125 RepID=A0AAV4RR19_9ARAC|nr:hypothetical protein CDAR_591171 [Caerostris darwini]
MLIKNDHIDHLERIRIFLFQLSGKPFCTTDLSYPSLETLDTASFSNFPSLISKPNIVFSCHYGLFRKLSFKQSLKCQLRKGHQKNSVSFVNSAFKGNEDP